MSALGLLLLVFDMGCSGSKGVTASVSAPPAAPTISAQPSSLAVDPGGAATFSVSATGTAPLNYQWRKNATAIGGAALPSYTIPSVQTADSGRYDVVVSNAAGSATSSAATLTVNAALASPAFTTQPANQTVLVGGTAAFTVAASGNPAPAFQWQRSDGGAWSALSGQTGATLSLAGLQASDNGASFRCIATNSQGSATSSAATLTVNAAPAPPAFTTQPANQTALVGGTAAFTVAASGNPAPAFQWQRSDGGAWSALSGQTGTTLSLAGLQASDNGASFRCIATNSQGSATSSAATLTVNAAPAPPIITAQPRSRSVKTGTQATFSVVALGVGLTYQWRQGGASLAGATSAVYTIPSAQPAQAGTYDVVVGNDAGASITSASATLSLANPNVIDLASPGADADIRPSLQAAIDAAASGDEIHLPEGAFVVNGTVRVVNKSVSILGKGIGKTSLYRSESVADSNLQDIPILRVQANSTASSDIVVSDITFRSKNPIADGGGAAFGGGGSLASDIGIEVQDTADFTVTRCRFEYFGNAAVSVRHANTVARGLICKNEFFRNFKGLTQKAAEDQAKAANIPFDPNQTWGLGLGYGVAVYGAETQWIPDPAFGTDNFIFIEDNTFDCHRHAVAAGSNGLYVCRNNTVTRNHVSQYTHALDAHEGRGAGHPGNVFSTRAVEIYDNTVINGTTYRGDPLTSSLPSTALVEAAIRIRGGEALIYGNVIDGYRFGTGISVNVLTPGYPVMSQTGYGSGAAYGASHSGIDAAHGDGDLFHWSDRFTPRPGNGSASVGAFYNYDTTATSNTYLKADRDYHLVPKPGYLPYTYPHPRRQ